MTYQEYLASLDPFSRIVHMTPQAGHASAPENTGLFGRFADWVQNPMRPEREFAFGSAADVARGWTQGQKAPYTDLVMAGMDVMPGLDDIATKGLLAAGTAIGPAWLGKRMWGKPANTSKLGYELGLPSKADDFAGYGDYGYELAGSPAAAEAISPERVARAKDLVKRYNEAKVPIEKQAVEAEMIQEFGGAQSAGIAAMGERSAAAGGPPMPGSSGLLGDAFKKQRGRIGDFDPRFDPRIKEQERLQNLDVSVAGAGAQPGLLSIADFEGKPFISSMSDRTRAGGDLVGVNNRQLNSPVGLLGGQDYMFNNPGQVWASGAAPVRQIHGLAQDVKRLTGEDPLFMPWRMAPTGGDFAHMTGETMLSYADVGMNKKNKAKANTAIKKLIPGWKGIGDPASIEQFRSAPDAIRKTIKNTLDTRFRDAGGLGIGEARLAVSDPAQYMAKDSGLMNVGRIHAGRPVVADSGHPSYPKGVPGEGLGRLKEDLNVFQLLPDVVRARGMDAMSPRQTDIRAMQMKPYAGIITPELLKSLGL